MKFIQTRFSKIVILVVLVSLLVGLILVAPQASVQAAAPGQAGTPPAPQGQSPAVPNPAVRDQRLENMYQREQKLLAAQGNRLGRVDTLTNRAETLLQKLKDKGIDVAALETALTDFKAAIPAATAAHQAAATILSTHAGFDAAGKVTDAKVAQETVRDARQSLQDCHQVLRKAFRNLIHEIRTFRRAHPQAAS